MNIEMYRLFAAVQQKHWWFVARKRIVLATIARHFRSTGNTSVLDIGCGAGLMLNELQQFGHTCGMDSAETAIELCREIFNGDVRLGYQPDQIPYPRAAFQLVTALDVIEHIDDDIESLKAIHGMLAPGGMAVITVPAYMFLWSEFDEINEHRRRYTRGELGRKIRTAGFKIEMISYFNTLLFPVAWAVRMRNRWLNRSGAAELQLPGQLINSLLTRLFGLESHLLRLLSLPFGVSIIAVVHRDRDESSSGGMVEPT